MKEVLELIGKCGFYCGSCPDYAEGICSGCRKAHSRGDCFTFDCVDSKGISFCGHCDRFPCEEVMTREKATVLDVRWLRWKARQRQERESRGSERKHND